MAWIGNLLGNILGGDVSQDKVVEVKLAKYTNAVILSRQENIALFDLSKEEQKYEIIMQRPTTESLNLAYSIYRTQSRSEAEKRFSILKERLPPLCNVSYPNLATLQKYCTAIKEHPSWSLCHLVVDFNLADCLNNPLVQCQVNSTDPVTGVSPLQLAIKEINLAMVRQLVSAGASVEHLDHEGNNALHYAAATNKEIVNVLLNGKECRCLNQCNLSGQSALHVACISNKPECVTALLIAGADVNIPCNGTGSSGGGSGGSTPPPGLIGDFMTDHHKKLHPQEMKYGGTPLHWSSSKEVIEALLDCNCHINAVNFDSRTALHVMVMKERLECCVALLARAADPNLTDADGNTALHLAATKYNLPILQALIVFGADLSLLNNKGETVRHLVSSRTGETEAQCLYVVHAVGAARCEVKLTCGAGCAPGSDYCGIPPPPASAPLPRQVQQALEAAVLDAPPITRGGRILALDGGGIRGLVLVMLLIELEKAVGKPVLHCFDWLAATSTGAILALAIAAGKSLQECLCLYFNMKDKAFAGFRPYNSEPLDNILKQTLGTDTKMTDITHPKLMITGCLADRKPVELHIFRNYESSAELLGEAGRAEPLCLPALPGPSDQLLWEAARASGAAPSYFRAFGRFVDGGLISNNPTLDALTEIHEYNTALRLVGREGDATPASLVVSIGTGSVPVTQVESMDIFWPSGVWDAAKLVTGVRSMQAVLVDQATQADGRVIERTRALCSMLNIPYFRFSPQMSEDIVMDEKSDTKLVNLLWETKAYITSQSQLVHKLAQLLNN